jgi:hypothetical protein
MINLSMDREFFVVFSDHLAGVYVPEHNVWEMDRARTVQQIADGQFEDVVKVIAFNPAERTSRDATLEIAALVIQEWEDRDDDFDEWRLGFCETFLGVIEANAHRRAA